MSHNLTVNLINQNRDRLLDELRKRQAVIRDRVRGVARKRYSGLYLYGAPGTAKTHSVRAVLDREIQEIYAYQRGHLTPLGLFELLKEHRDEVIVLDDLAAIFKSPTALQLLLAGWNPPPQATSAAGSNIADRVVRIRFPFAAGSSASRICSCTTASC